MCSAVAEEEWSLSGASYSPLLTSEMGASVCALLLFNFEAGSHYMALTGLELTMDTRLAPASSVSRVLFIN